ncbi:MAG TPA: hypothetical protein VGX94_18720 [Terriglobia bacterium]|nr:hypothetical protein [Terriglobia bacterium]
MRDLKIVLLIIASLVSPSAGAHVFIRWTESSIPPAKALGVQNLVITWTAPDNPLFQAAKRQGYRVYAEVTPAWAAAAARASKSEGLAGIIVAAPGIEPAGSLDELIKSLRAEFPSLDVRLLEPGGKQPQMRGGIVVGKNGVLGVSSPTRQPWIDSNVALVRFARVYHPGEAPLIDFTWNLIDPTEQQYGPPAVDYEIAIAEAASFHTDLILPIHKNLQKDLIQRNPQGWKTWDGILRYIRFYQPIVVNRTLHLLSNVGFITNDYDASYEAANLMARHNIPFDVMMPGALTSKRLKDMALVVIFGPLDTAAAGTVKNFAENGGTAVLVGQPGKYPWSSLQPASKNEDTAIYLTGKGKIVEIAEPITDPEAFAKDVWRLLSTPQRQLSLWNALTTLAAAYQVGGFSLRLNLVNYSGNPLRVQTRVKGAYSAVSYETPEHGSWAPLKPVEQDGFTEFIVPNFLVGARVRLSEAGSR